MTRTLLRAAFAVALASTLTAGGSSVTAAPVAAPTAAAAATADCRETGRQDDRAGAAARLRPGQVGTATDTRGLGRVEQRRIDARTPLLARERREARAGVGSTMASIPVHVHVMLGRRGVGNVTGAQVVRQVAVLNQTYGGTDVNGVGLDTGARFHLASTERITNRAWHLDRESTRYRARTRDGGRNALNIWLVGFEQLGAATFPWDYARSPRVDGIRVHFATLPGGRATNYNLGETVTHEVGHWLGLLHTFQGGCTSPGDSVADTPSQASPSTGCPTTRDSCPAPGLDPVRNYMDYSFDRCYTTFSPGQDARMDQMWAAYRA